jgi:predicted RNA-binding protein (virulence factor B family)
MRIGEIQTLRVARVSEYGLYLADEEGNEVLLPNRYVSLTQKVDDEVEVFVYHDSEDRIVATTETPKITAGKVAWLKVVDKNIHGAFLDWGVTGKDLFLPNRNQQGGVLVGSYKPVYMYVDNITERCVATTKLKTYVNNEGVVTLSPRQKVEALIVSESEIGYRAIVENRHWGMIYKNQLFRNVELGDKVEAYVSRITEDNRVDLSLQQKGFAQVKDSAEVLYDAIVEAGGRLALTDNSSPEEIREQLNMSKKLFKRSLGVLMSHNRVECGDNYIRVKE